MQGDGQGHRQPLTGEPADEGNEAHGGDGDTASRQAEALRGRVNEPMEGADDILVVDHRLTHAHEDHVGQSGRPPGQLPGGRGLGGVAHLLHDLPGGQVAGQAHLTGGAEGAGHAATGLGGDAQGGALLVAHEDALDADAVVQLPQMLDGASAVGAQARTGVMSSGSSSAHSCSRWAAGRSVMSAL